MCLYLHASKGKGRHRSYRKKVIDLTPTLLPPPHNICLLLTSTICRLRYSCWYKFRCRCCYRLPVPVPVPIRVAIVAGAGAGANADADDRADAIAIEIVSTGAKAFCTVN